MVDAALLDAVVSLGQQEARFERARHLAAQFGAEVLLILVEDRDVEGLVPAQGFPPTLPGGPAWRDLLRRMREPGCHDGHVGYPTPGTLLSASALSGDGVVLLFLGGRVERAALERLRQVQPLLAALIRAEHDRAVARGEQRAAANQAREAGALAAALDAARTEIEQTLRRLEGQTAALEDARVRAEDAIRAKDAFLAMLGHELRNPLSPIVTALQVLRMKGQVSRELSIIERQVTNLMRLVDDLMDVSRLTSGKIQLRRESVEIGDVVARAIEMASPLLEQKQQTLAVDVPPRGMRVEADPSRLAQVIANLLTNASKYSDSGTRVRLAAEGDDARLRIRVQDEGIGIGAEMLGRVFDVFFQQPQSIERSQGGLGLGLAIVRSLVGLHGGSVRVLSDGEGKGSEFIVELPRLGAAAAGSGDERLAGRRLSRVDRSHERVLVVDDNPDALIMMGDALRWLGYTVQMAPDGPTAVRIAATFRPDIALVDIGLPVMDGYEVAERLRELDSAGPPRVVAVTGYGQDADRERSTAAGFEAHLVKPIPLETLEQVLQELRSARGPSQSATG